MKNFQLSTSKTIQLAPAVPAKIITITFLNRSIEDDGTQVTAKVYFSELPDPMLLTLWDSLVYANVQNWTDDMANERILEILGAQ